MKIQMKYTAEEVPENNICTEILLEFVENILEENRTDVKLKFDEEDDVQETPEMKRNYYEAFKIDEEVLWTKMY